MDTSVVGPCYWPERLSDAAQAFVRRHAAAAVSDLVEVEFFAALGRRVRMGDIPVEDARRVATLFLTHIEGRQFERVPLDRPVYLTARSWLGGFDIALGALDALHLAVAAARGFELATADAEMARAAGKLGIRVHHVRVRDTD